MGELTKPVKVSPPIEMMVPFLPNGAYAIVLNVTGFVPSGSPLTVLNVSVSKSKINMSDGNFSPCWVGVLLEIDPPL